MDKNRFLDWYCRYCRLPDHDFCVWYDFFLGHVKKWVLAVKLSVKLIWSIVSVLLLAVYLMYDPALYSLFPRCPFWMCTGLYCPGCGSQRALHQICTGHFIRAADNNLLAVLYSPLIVAWYISFFREQSSFHLKLVQLVNNRSFVYATLGIVILFCIIRNTNTYLGHQLAP